MQTFSWEGTPLPRPHSPRRLRRLDLRAYGAQAQRDTPQKILVTALIATSPDVALKSLALT